MIQCSFCRNPSGELRFQIHETGIPTPGHIRDSMPRGLLSWNPEGFKATAFVDISPAREFPKDGAGALDATPVHVLFHRPLQPDLDVVGTLVVPFDCSLDRSIITVRHRKLSEKYCCFCDTGGLKILLFI